MENPNTPILELISAYTTNEISEEQYTELHQWLNASPDNEQLFSDYLHLYKKSRRIGLVQSVDKSEAWNKIISQLETPLVKPTKVSKSNKPSLRKPWFNYAAAAIIAGILVSGYFFRDSLFNPTENTSPIIVTRDINIGTDKAVLTLEDGTSIELEKGQIYTSENLKSNGEKLVYDSISIATPEIVYNSLTIPRGGQFNVTLADGTQVWLNSESKLKYPISFIDGKTREIELVYGEAYFDISHSTEHQGSSFIVQVRGQEIEVLGTEFNIKAYQDEDVLYTTLVKGEIALTIGAKKEILSPNQQAIVTIQSNEMLVISKDPRSEVSWIHGEFIFNRKSLKDIMKVLSRWYDVDVVFENKTLEDIEFNGELSKYQNIEDIITLIKNTNLINGYEITPTTLIIK